MGLLVLWTDLNFDALIREPCVILTHTYFQSNQDSGHLAHQQNQIGMVGNTKLCLTTFLSMMLIGLNIISGSCILKLIGWKFTSFLHLCFHFSRKHVAFTWFTCAKKRLAAKSYEMSSREREILKQLKKILAQL